MKLVVALLATVFVLAGCSSPEVRSEPSDRLPAVTLKSLDDVASLDLRTLRGPLVVNLWASWCTPCRKELPEYQAYAEKYAGTVDVIGIDFQETRPDAARQLAAETGLTYPLFADPDGKLRAIGLPKLILVDADGKITHEEYVKITSVGQLAGLVEKHLGVAP